MSKNFFLSLSAQEKMKYLPFEIVLLRFKQKRLGPENLVLLFRSDISDGGIFTLEFNNYSYYFNCCIDLHR